MASVISGGQLRSLGSPYPDVFGGVEYTSTGDFAEVVPEPPTLDVEAMWRSQPSVRKVIDFIARALASTPVKVYRRESDSDRQRLLDHPAARVLAQPRPGMTAFRFWHSVAVDALLYDRWCVVKSPTLDDARPLDLTRVQSARIRFADDNLGNVRTVWVDGSKAVDPAACMLDHGYSPRSANGTSPMETLAAILQESAEAVAYRRGVWKNSARIPVILERPVGAPNWTENGGRERFAASWRNFIKGGGREGGTPILEDGMKLSKVDAFSPRDTNDIEGRQLNDAEVASAFHVAPELVGSREGNYSNIAAFREMLYGDALGPYYTPLQQVINLMLVAELDPSGEVYAEFDIEAKMRGSFATQAAVISTSVGRPWMTAGEARSRMNLPDLGGDTHGLVTPLNVLVGGQASPRDSGSQNRKAGDWARAKQRYAKARAARSYQAKAQEVLTAFFTEQEAAVLAALDKKAAADFWDTDRWDTELTQRLFALSATVAAEIGPQAAESLGFDPGDYDAERTLAWLSAASATRAANINTTTLTQVTDALESAGEDETPDAVFALAVAQRAPAAAASIVTAVSGFATTEAARQLAPDTATKTWRTGQHARPSHAAMDGDTVAVDEVFSNGMAWPGDGGDADEVAGCNCAVTVSAN